VASETAGQPAGTGERRTGTVSRLLRRAGWPSWSAPLELFVLCGLAVAQPLLDVTGKAPDFFLLHRASRWQILLLVALVVVLPPLVLWLAELAVGLVAGERARGLLHWALVTGLLVLLAVEVGKDLLPLRGRPLVLAGLVAGLAVGLLYWRWPPLRLWLRYLAPAPLVFALLFATTSPTAQLILPSRVAGTGVPVRTDPSRPLPPVVMILFDEFPLQALLDSSGQIDARVYPHFAEFANQATWYRNATAVSGWTPYAVPAVLTGRYPDRGHRSAAPVAQRYPDNLFTMFGHYYDMKAYETITRLCPPERCAGSQASTGFGEVARETARLYKDIASPQDAPADPAFLDDGGDVASTAGQGPTALFTNLGGNQVARADSFARSINAGDRQPTLYFLHLLLPHSPWRYLPDGRVYGNPIGREPKTSAGTWPEGVQQVNQQRMLMQLAWTDKVLGTVIDRLKRQGLYDKSLVVMTADHGAGFSPAVLSRELDGNEPTLMWVPMLLKAPGQTKGRVDDRNWEHVDLLPTLAEGAGLTVPWKVDGYSGLGEPRRPRTDKWWYGTPGERQVRDGPPIFRKVLGGVTDTLVRAHQHGDRGFWQYGAGADWVYRTPAEVGRVTGAAGHARVANWDRFRAVTPDTPAPAMIVGELTSGTPPPGSRLVLGVNGRIAATATLYPPREGAPATGFAAMLPGSLFRAGPGQPQLQAWVASRSGGQVLLQPVSLSG
jgi:hypothetical protein